MGKHFARELQHLKDSLIELSELVEVRVREALLALEKGDESQARKVIEGDKEIDLREVELEEACLQVLALYQPVAIDLRLVNSILKINNDLERIGDVAVNISQRAIRLLAIPEQSVPKEIWQIARKVKLMFRKSLLCLVELDLDIAQDVLRADEEVDEMHAEMYETLLEALKSRNGDPEGLVVLMSVSKQLERVADLSSNIAEDVVYLLTGDIVRHGKWIDYRPSNVVPINKGETLKKITF